MSTFGGGGNFISSETTASTTNNQFGATPRTPLTTGYKRLHSESPGSTPISKSPRRSSASGIGSGDGNNDGTSSSSSERLLQLISGDVWKLRSKHHRHLAELLYVESDGSFLDFETWLNSSPPQLVAYLQAHSYDISKIFSGRSSAAITTAAPLPSSPSPSVWNVSESSSVERSIVTPAITAAVDMKSPIKIGFPSIPESVSVNSSTSEDRGQQSIVIATPTAAIQPQQQSIADSSFLVESAPASSATSSSSFTSGGVLPMITLATPSSTTTPASTSVTPLSSASSATTATSATRSLLEAHLAAKQTVVRPQAPTHRGPGRPPGKKNANTLANGPPRYRPPPILDGRIEHAAKHEVAVMQKIAALRRDGLWSADKLPKCADPPRSKTHWDLLLEEMKWLWNDFEQERKWKKQKARKIGAEVVRQRKDDDDKHKRVEVEREKELRRIASFAAKEVKQFWNNIERVVGYKSDSIMEAKRKRALDRHLDDIVSQTERFSSLVQEGLVRPSTSSAPTSVADEAETDFGPDFEAEESSEDDESTIDKEEKHIDKEDVDEEVAMLQQECDMDFDDILDSLPPGYLDAFGASSEPGPSTSADAADDDNESMSSDSSDRETETQASRVEELPEDVDFSKLRSDNSDVRQQELTHFAETAEKLQPKGYTLETTTVVTKVPFLLKHQLREYQHVGLDWLVTLFDRKLNGILADEMGLGKTIQTIALLAHLACDKENWGPHLIIVPTTVMLNWEMELKKWCPGFKILTYYGSVKERKEKRHGWSKPNAFHVCITSYKLVLQDHLVFRRKKWEYLILDEAQNIKNFKSQRWQMLLHFNAQRRLLLTGTPLQNSLMELWSLMHFLMPDIFASHRDFNDWFSNPVTNMIEGSREFDEQTVRRLHKVLRPFLLRRLKSEVEKQLPKKYEHIVDCPLSKRQRYLYDDFMSRASTKDQLSTGNVMSVLNILMQLRKVCNHPNLFESRAIMSPYVMRRLLIKFPSEVNKLAKEQADDRIPCFLLLQQCRRDTCIRCKQLAPERRLIEELPDDGPGTSKRPPSVPGFKFAPLKAPIRGAMSSASARKNDIQFVIQPHVAKDFNFNHPFLVKMLDDKMVPILIRPPQPEAMIKIGLPPPTEAASSSSSTPAAPDAPVQLPVYRLSQPSQLGAPLLQPPLTGIRASRGASTTSRMAIVARPPGLSVTLVSPKPGPVPFGNEMTNSVFRARTVRFRPGVPRTGALAGPSGSPSRPQITVHDIRPNTPPTIRFVDPARRLTTMSASKPSSPLVVVPAPSPSTVASNAALLLPSPEESVGGSEADANEKTGVDTSPMDVESVAAAPIAVLKRSASEAGLDELPVATKRASTEYRQQRLQWLAMENERRNHFEPLYGSELEELLSIQREDCAISLRRTFEDISSELAPMISRFCIYTPAIISGLPQTTCSSNDLESDLGSIWPELNTSFKAVIDSQMLHFPELRLIEYDCGKLQILTGLLRKLKDGGHRCLIFTQMTKMLDILEAFLSYLGLKYLRLDGATNVELRQVLMERFNQDPRIFCMILSTRSGGLGVNLTGADTVIFYDSDWNPTMDAQAQDRCHRIGQTRDVHIYRLISEKTVEENILKKAAQKRRLGEVAIEEGSFTTEFFKKGNLKEIFDLNEEVAVRDEDASLSQQELEQQMARLEDENDAQAARCAKAETMAELSEFDENQAAGGDEDADPDVVEVENKMRQLMAELKPVERYAVKYLETLHEPDLLDELQQTEEQIQQRKLQWELANRDRLEQEEAQRKRDEEEEFELTYGYEDSLAQMFCPAEPNEQMPIWLPPSPPESHGEFDPYIDSSMSLLYSMDPMEEGDLPPIAGELDLFRTPTKSESTTASAHHQGTSGAGTPSSTRPPSSASTSNMSDIPAAVAETVANIRNSTFNRMPKNDQPRSLFEGASAAARVQKRDVRRPLTPPSPSSIVEQQETTAVDFPEWGILEDWALWQAVTKGQQMPYSLVSSHPGHTVNWDYVSKWVSSVVHHYCSPRACHTRYQHVILPREEGRVVTIDALAKKQRKNAPHQDIAAMKKFRMRTGQQFQQEGASFMATRMKEKFKAVQKGATKRKSMTSDRASGVGLANCLPATIPARRRQEAHLQSLGYNPERVMNPIQFADMREERVREMKKQQQQFQQQQQQQMQQAQQQAQQQQQQLQQQNTAFIQSYQQQQHQPTPGQHSMPFQSPPIHQPTQSMLNVLPQYPQAPPPAQTQTQGMMEASPQHHMVTRPIGPISVSSYAGIASSASGSMHQQPIQVSLQQPPQSHHHQQQQQQQQQQSMQSQMDMGQISVTLHAGRLLPNPHHIRSPSVSSHQTSGGGGTISHMLAAGGQRPQGVGIGTAGMGTRPGMAPGMTTTTATVYRQVNASGALIRSQRTPPSTPAPAGLLTGPSVQISPVPMHQQRPQGIMQSISTPVPVSISNMDSVATTIIGPVVVQQQPSTTTIRLQGVPGVGVGGRQKIQFGGTGGFLVSAESKPTVVPIPSMQMTSSAPGPSHQAISITNAGRGGAGMGPRHVQISQSGIVGATKKGLALPRIATLTHPGNRGAASPVHFVSGQVGGRLTHTVQGVRAPSPSQFIRAPNPNVGMSGGRNIPSINMIMPPVGRLETIQGSAAPGVSVSTAPVSASSATMHHGHMIVATTSTAATISSPQGIPTTSAPASTSSSQSFGSNRGQ